MLFLALAGGGKVRVGFWGWEGGVGREAGCWDLPVSYVRYFIIYYSFLVLLYCIFNQNLGKAKQHRPLCTPGLHVKRAGLFPSV